MNKQLLTIIIFLVFTGSIWAQSLDQTHIDYVNPLTYGVECNATTLSATVTAIGESQKSIFLTATNRSKVECTWQISGNIVIPSNIMVRVPFGVHAVVASGSSLTIEGCLNADEKDWKSGAGLLTVNSYCASEADIWMGSFSRGFVESGCIHGLSLTNVASISSCSAYVLESVGALKRLVRVNYTTAQNLTYTGLDGDYWTLIRSNFNVNPSGWTCVANSPYCIKYSADPPIYPNGTVGVLHVVITGGIIKESGDIRPDTPDRSDPVSLMSPLFGAVGDCIVDDTAAIHAWYANASWRKTPAYAPQPPSKCYKFTRWSLIYHGIYGTMLPQNTLKYGEMRVFGDGAMDTADMNASYYHGTVFESTELSNPALFGDSSGDITNPFRHMKLTGMTFIGNNTSSIIELKGMSSQSVIGDLTVYQRSVIGGGIVIEDTFLTNFYNMFIYNANSDDATATGIGLAVRNSVKSGSLIHLNNVSARGFGGPGGIGILFGHLTQAGATQIGGIHGLGVQGIASETSIVLGAGVAGATLIAPHSEQATLRGIYAYNASRGLTIIGGTFNNNATVADVQIGNDTLPGVEEEANAVTLIGNLFQGIKTIGVLRTVSAEMTGGTFIGNVFGAAVGGTAIGIQCGSVGITIQRNLSLIGNYWPSTVSPNKFQYQTRYCGQTELEVSSTFTRIGGGLSITRTPANESPDIVHPLSQIQEFSHKLATIDFPPIAINTCVDQTVAYTGITGSDFPLIRKPAQALVAGVIYEGRVVSPDQVVIRGCNVGPSASADPASGEFGIIAIRME